MAIVAEQKTNKFEHNGFTCTIMQRPDLLYMYQVHGVDRVKETVWSPKVMFDKDLSVEEIKKAAIEMMDGTFDGEVEVYGNFHVFTGAKHDSNDETKQAGREEIDTGGRAVICTGGSRERIRGNSWRPLVQGVAGRS